MGHCETSGSIGDVYSMSSEVCSRARRRIVGNIGSIEIMEYIALARVEKLL